jgi:hypothetical protein
MGLLVATIPQPLYPTRLEELWSNNYLAFYHEIYILKYYFVILSSTDLVNLR